MEAKTYCYNEQTDDLDGCKLITITTDEILRDYWPYWKEAMEKAGKHHLISPEACVDDFVVVRWAWEKKETGK